MPKKPRPPMHLTPEGQVLWRDLYASYQIDLPAEQMLLTALVESWERARACRIALAAEGHGGLTFVDRFGVARLHPLATEERASRDQINRLAKTLRIHLSPGTDDAT